MPVKWRRRHDPTHYITQRNVKKAESIALQNKLNEENIIQQQLKEKKEKLLNNEDMNYKNDDEIITWMYQDPKVVSKNINDSEIDDNRGNNETEIANVNDSLTSRKRLNSAYSNNLNAINNDSDDDNDVDDEEDKYVKEFRMKLEKHQQGDYSTSSSLPLPSSSAVTIKVILTPYRFGYTVNTATTTTLSSLNNNNISSNSNSNNNSSSSSNSNIENGSGIFRSSKEKREDLLVKMMTLTHVMKGNEDNTDGHWGRDHFDMDEDADITEGKSMK